MEKQAMNCVRVLIVCLSISLGLVSSASAQKVEDDKRKGDITAVNAGTGLSGGGTQGDVTLSVTPAYQLPQACATGDVAKSDGAGGWSCAADDNSGGTVTAVTASAPLTSSGGTMPNIALPNVIIQTDNTAIGTGALSSNTPGIDGAGDPQGVLNTASGSGALQNNTIGNYNTASGNRALFSNTAGAANTASGIDAIYRNSTGSNNTASGTSALFGNTTGNNNTASGVEALAFNTTGTNNTAVGAFANVTAGNLTNATAIGADARVNASNKIRLGDAAVTVIEGQVGFTSVSDQTKKENFQRVDGEEVLTKIGGLALTSWNFIGHDTKQFRHYGPVAQEFFAAFGHDGIGTIGTPTTISSTDMAGILMIGVQTLGKRTTQLRHENNRLKEAVETFKAENADLKMRLEALEGLLFAKDGLEQK